MDEDRPGGSPVPSSWASEAEKSPTSVMAGSFETANAVIVLPTLNEEGGLSQTLLDIPFDRLAGAGWKVLPLVVDGGSTDRTLEVAAAWGLPILHQKSRGKGGAVREALDWLAERNVRYAVVLDADASYPGASILPALELLGAGSHLVVGVRQSAAGAPRNFRDLLHRVGNALLNFVAGQFSRARFLDVCSGFWGVHIERALELGLQSNDFGIEAELFLKGQRASWTIRQIPIPYRVRVGEPKLHTVSDGMRILLAIIRFGHRTLKAAPPATSLLPAFVRDLLVTALVGGGDLVLLTPPARESDTRAVATLLERSGLRPRVVVLAEGPESPSSPSDDFPRPARTDVGIVGSPSAEDSELRAARYLGPVIRFGQSRRTLYVEVPDLEPWSAPSDRGVATASASFRSGAYAPRPGGPGDLLDPIRTLASRLNHDVRETRASFLRANGLSVQDGYEGPYGAADEGPNSTRSPSGPAPEGSFSKSA